MAMARCGASSPALGGKIFRTEPKKVSELTQFCEERDLMSTCVAMGLRALRNRPGWAKPSPRNAIGCSTDLRKADQPRGTQTRRPSMRSRQRMAAIVEGIAELPIRTSSDFGGERWGRGGERGRQTFPFARSNRSNYLRRSGERGERGTFIPSSREEKSHLTHEHTYRRAVRKCE